MQAEKERQKHLHVSISAGVYGSIYSDHAVQRIEKDEEIQQMQANDEYVTHDARIDPDSEEVTEEPWLAHQQPEWKQVGKSRDDEEGTQQRNRNARHQIGDQGPPVSSAGALSLLRSTRRMELSKVSARQEHGAFHNEEDAGKQPDGGAGIVSRIAPGMDGCPTCPQERYSHADDTHGNQKGCYYSLHRTVLSCHINRPIPEPVSHYIHSLRIVP